MTNYPLDVECVLAGNIKQAIAKRCKEGQHGEKVGQHTHTSYITT